MKLIRVQEAYRRKFERQRQIKELEYHAAGHCVHLGKLSPGCAKCFLPDRFSRNFTVGEECNLNCPYCFGQSGGQPFSLENLLVKKGVLFSQALAVDLADLIPTISFTGGGDPLMALDVVKALMDFYRGIEDCLSKKPWYYLYTNGVLADLDTLLRLKDMGFDEIRFHLGASNFSPTVYRHLALAARHIPVVTVETPAWPPHRPKLFEMLPRIQDLGVKHLNLGEIQVTAQNQAMIERLLPDAEIYQARTIHLDDGGLVYDLVEEVIKQGYNYSVLDCNCFVKMIQTTPAKWEICEPVAGLCTEYSPFPTSSQMPVEPLKEEQEGCCPTKES